MLELSLITSQCRGHENGRRFAVQLSRMYIVHSLRYIPYTKGSLDKTFSNLMKQFWALPWKKIITRILCVCCGLMLVQEADQSINASIRGRPNQSINASIGGRPKQSINASIEGWLNQSINASIEGWPNQSINASLEGWHNQSIHASIEGWPNQSINASIECWPNQSINASIEGWPNQSIMLV